jgi:uncharacterized RDD family membrane protein YckC
VSGRNPYGLIESYYDAGQLQPATFKRRLGALLLDSLIAITTLGIGWLLWFFIQSARRGQTPGKQFTGLYVIRDDASRAGGWYMLVREFVVKTLLFEAAPQILLFIFWAIILIFAGTNGNDDEFSDMVANLVYLTWTPFWLLCGLWMLWDSDRQTLWDKVARTRVAYSPNDFRPLTSKELARLGRVTPQRPTDRRLHLESLLREGHITREEYDRLTRES